MRFYSETYGKLWGDDPIDWVDVDRSDILKAKQAMKRAELEDEDDGEESNPVYHALRRHVGHNVNVETMTMDIIVVGNVTYKADRAVDELIYGWVNGTHNMHPVSLVFDHPKKMDIRR